MQCCGSGSGIGCLFDPWIRDKPIPDPGSRIPNSYFWELSEIWVKSSIIIWNLAQIFFLEQLKNKIILHFGKFVATKNVWQKFFFHHSLFYLFLDPGSEIRDPGRVKIRIRDKHPGSATLPEFTCDGPKLADLFPHPFRKALTITEQRQRQI